LHYFYVTKRDAAVFAERHAEFFANGVAVLQQEKTNSCRQLLQRCPAGRECRLLEGILSYACVEDDLRAR
jgi:hypothetical protein